VECVMHPQNWTPPRERKLIQGVEPNLWDHINANTRRNLSFQPLGVKSHIA
jgi:hypothetical protein